MDIVTLAMAKPKIVNLTQFKASNGYSFNDLILSLMQSSMTASGELKEMVVEDANLSLRTALSTNKLLVGEMVYENLTMKVPLTVVLEEDGICNQINGGILVYLSGVIVDVKLIIQFDKFDNNPDTAVFVKADVVGTSDFT